MRDRRKRQTLNVGEGLFPDRRVHLLGRRRHQGFTRILFIDLFALWNRLKSKDLARNNHLIGSHNHR